MAQGSGTREEMDNAGADHALAAAPLEARAWDRVGGRPAAWTFLVFLLAWMGVIFTVWTTWPGQDHGTRMADSNILNAGRNFEAHGLGFHHGVPSLETYEDAERRPALYGTYPPGPYWIHALLRQSGLTSLSQIRGASVVGSGVAGVLALAAFGVLTRSWMAGALAAGFYCFSAPFSAWADSVHMNVWMQIALLTFLIGWVGFERTRGPWRWALLALAGMAYLADIWLNLEHVLLIAIVVAVRTVISRRWSVWIGGGVLAAVAALGIASRVWHLTLEFDTIDGVREYLTRKYEHRSGDEGGGADGYALGEVFGPWMAQLWWTDPGSRSRLREFGYPFLWWPVLLSAGGLLLTMLGVRLRSAWRARTLEKGPTGPDGPRDARAGAADAVAAVWDTRVEALRAPRAGLGWGALLLLAALHWHVWMRQHASAHPHVMLDLLPGMALILGSLATGGMRLACADARAAGPLRWIGLPLAVGLIAAFGFHLKYGAVLNRLFPLTDMHAEVRAREHADQWWRDLGAALQRRFAPVRRVVLFHWGPRQANLMGLPHQYVEGGGMPASFGMPEGTWNPTGDAPGTPDAAMSAQPSAIPRGPGQDLLLIEFPRPGKPPRVAMTQGFDRFGFPEIESGPETTALVFTRPPANDLARAGADPAAWLADDLDVRFAGGIRLLRVRLSRNITGTAWVVCAELRGPAEAPFTPDPPGPEARPPDGTSQSAGTAQTGAADPPDTGVAPDADDEAGPPSEAPAQAGSVRVLLSARPTTPGSVAPRIASVPQHRVRYQGRSFMWVYLPLEALPDGRGEVRIGLSPRGRAGRVEIERAGEPPTGMTVDLDTDEIVWRVGGER